MTTCERPSRQCCAPAVPLSSGARVRLYASPLRWTVVDVSTRIIGGVPCVVAYRLLSVTPMGLRELTVPPELLERDEGCGAIAGARERWVGAPDRKLQSDTFAVVIDGDAGVDVPAEASQTVREELRTAEAAEPVAQTGDGKKEPDPWIVWTQVTGSTRKSADGRFEIDITNSWYHAYDRWTREAVARLATLSAAEQWCRTRTNAPALDWQEFPGCYVAKTPEGLAFAVTSNGIVSQSRDGRFAPGSPLRESPIFMNKIEAAKAWCEARACCTVEPGLSGSPPTLRYQDPVPF